MAARRVRIVIAMASAMLRKRATAVTVVSVRLCFVVFVGRAESYTPPTELSSVSAETVVSVVRSSVTAVFGCRPPLLDLVLCADCSSVVELCLSHVGQISQMSVGARAESCCVVLAQPNTHIPHRPLATGTPPQAHGPMNGGRGKQVGKRQKCVSVPSWTVYPKNSTEASCSDPPHGRLPHP